MSKWPVLNEAVMHINYIVLDCHAVKKTSLSLRNKPVTRNLPFLIIEKQQLCVSLQRQLLCNSPTVVHNQEDYGK